MSAVCLGRGKKGATTNLSAHVLCVLGYTCGPWLAEKVAEGAKELTFCQELGTRDEPL